MAEPDRAPAPRFVLRFAVITALGLALAGAAILLFLRQDDLAQAEHAVTFHAQAFKILRPDPELLEMRLPGLRVAELLVRVFG